MKNFKEFKKYVEERGLELNNYEMTLRYSYYLMGYSEAKKELKKNENHNRIRQGRRIYT
jgi:hypothetical protein